MGWLCVGFGFEFLGGLKDMESVSRQYGITKPISTAMPTEADLQRTVELEKARSLFIALCFYSIKWNWTHCANFGHVFFIYKLQFLVDAGLYESKEECAKREEVLGEINQVPCFVDIIRHAYLFL